MAGGARCSTFVEFLGAAKGCFRDEKQSVFTYGGVAEKRQCYPEVSTPPRGGMSV